MFVLTMNAGGYQILAVLSIVSPILLTKISQELTKARIFDMLDSVILLGGTTIRPTTPEQLHRYRVHAVIYDLHRLRDLLRTGKTIPHELVETLLLCYPDVTLADLLARGLVSDGKSPECEAYTLDEKKVAQAMSDCLRRRAPKTTPMDRLRSVAQAWRDGERAPATLVQRLLPVLTTPEIAPPAPSHERFSLLSEEGIVPGFYTAWPGRAWGRRHASKNASST